ncbi:MAG: hypothetical protein ACT4PJ_12165 [Gemmatimonadaceae bacterium]
MRGRLVAGLSPGEDAALGRFLPPVGDKGVGDPGHRVAGRAAIEVDSHTHRPPRGVEHEHRATGRLVGGGVMPWRSTGRRGFR